MRAGAAGYNIAAGSFFLPGGSVTVYIDQHISIQPSMNHPFPTLHSRWTTSLMLAGLISSPALFAASVDLQNATATFSQSYGADFSVGRAIDGDSGGDFGWAIYDGTEFSGTTSAQTAVFETGLDVGQAGGSIVEFKLEFNLGWNPAHQLGRFRLSATTDSRATFADGLATGGDVTANWIVLNVTSAQSINGTTLTPQIDGSILASSKNPTTDTYTIRTTTGLVGITGFRLEALEDPTLPTSGPGMQPDNGNFVLSNFTVDLTAVPEPQEAVLAAGLLAAGGWLLARRGRRTR